MAAELTIARDSGNADGKFVRVLRCSGYVDANTLGDFEHSLMTSLNEGETRIVLDMGGLSYINSTGLGLLMNTYRHVRQSGGDLVIFGLSEKIANIFHLLGFSRLIRTFDDETSALRAIAEA